MPARKKKKLIVVRGLDKRISQAEFFSFFDRFEVEFLSSGFDQTWAKALARKPIKLVELELKPWLWLDPVKLIKGKTTHHSWIRLAGLEEPLKEAEVINGYGLYNFCSAQAARLAHRFQKLMTMIVWTSFPHPSRFIPPYCLNVQKTLAYTDLFLARSHKAAQDYLVSFLKVPSQKIKVIYPGVNLKRFHPVKKKNWSGLRLLFVGYLIESKGLLDLLAIFPRLCRQFSDLELWICGQGELEGKVKEVARNWPIEYLGLVDYLKMPQIYRSTDIFLSPSKDLYRWGIKMGEEFFSYVLLEAMASGLPIVGTRCGGIPEEVGEENLLVKQGDQEGLFLAIRELLADPGRRLELGKKNRVRAEKLYNIKEQAAKTETTILKFL